MGTFCLHALPVVHFPFPGWKVWRRRRSLYPPLYHYSSIFLHAYPSNCVCTFDNILRHVCHHHHLPAFCHTGMPFPVETFSVAIALPDIDMAFTASDTCTHFTFYYIAFFRLTVVLCCGVCSLLAAWKILLYLWYLYCLPVCWLYTLFPCLMPVLGTPCLSTYLSNFSHPTPSMQYFMLYHELPHCSMHNLQADRDRDRGRKVDDVFAVWDKHGTSWFHFAIATRAFRSFCFDLPYCCLPSFLHTLYTFETLLAFHAWPCLLRILTSTT